VMLTVYLIVDAENEYNMTLYFVPRRICPCICGHCLEVQLDHIHGQMVYINV
jgi:hypothetical protein